MLNKLPIQRLARDQNDSRGGGRTSRACDTCRQRKMKCDGTRPECSQCRAQGLATCFYSETRVEQDRRELELAKAKIEAYEKFLRDLCQGVETSTAKQIASVLQNPFKKESGRRRSSSVGSLDGIDTVDEDHNRSEESRATGHMGKSSEITWMHRLESEAKEQSGNPSSSKSLAQSGLPMSDPISSMNYRLDHDRLSNIEVMNPFVLPPKPLSDRLLQVYLDKVHNDIPLIRKCLFLEQYRRLFLGNRVNPGRGWLAIFNMVLAIASRFCKVSGHEFMGEPDDNVFFARAKALNLSENIGYDHEDLQQVQAEVLVAFYFITVSQVNRSWKMVGIASRAGVALGLHLREKDDQGDMQSSETRRRLWWSIFYLEHRLSVMTGRVSSCIRGDSCTERPPLPLEILEIGQSGYQQLPAEACELQWTLFQPDERLGALQAWLKSIAPSPPLHFFYIMDLTLISHDIANRVYTPGAHQLGWSRIKTRIEFYGKKMDRWVQSLHGSMVFQDNHGDPLPGSMSRFQISLALNYYSACIFLNRPCLTRPESDQSGHGFSRSHFDNETALTCLRASLALVAVLPDQPDIAWAYGVSPWWNLLPVLMQAAIVALIHISIGLLPTWTQQGIEIEDSSSGIGAGTAESTQVVFAAAEKALRWLHTLGATDEAAVRAFRLCNSCFQRIATSKGLDLSGMPSFSTQPSLISTTPDYLQPVNLATLQGLGGEGPASLELTSSQIQGFGDETESAFFQCVRTSIDSLQDPFLWPSSDISNMSEGVSHPSDATLEDILLSTMGYNI